MQQASRSSWGKHHHLKSNISYAEFQHAVPVTDYDGYFPWIERALLAEPDVLLPGQIRHFSQSSGTSSRRSKFLPVSSAGMQENHIRAATDLTAAYYLSAPQASLFQGKLMSVGGSLRTHPETGITTGDISALVTLFTPWLIQYYRKPATAIAQLNDWEEKIDAYAQHLATENISTIAGVPSWTYLILRRLLEHSGKQQIKELWPQIELFFHGGIAYGPYREKFRQIIGREIATRNCYNASEGFFAFQPDEQPGMLLLTHHGIFYEYIPFSAFLRGERKAIPLQETETGVDYVMVITTSSGLYRYMPGDVVRFLSVHPYRLELSGRTQSFLNLFGEEVMEHQLETALLETCKKLHASVTDYTVSAEIFADGRGRHVWHIEFDQMPSGTHDFTGFLDRQLTECNADYQVKRSHSLLLQPPAMKILPKGTIHRWFTRNGKLGGQHKFPKVMSTEEAEQLD